MTPATAAAAVMVALPFAAALVGLAVGRRRPEDVGSIAVTATALSLGASVVALVLAPAAGRVEEAAVRLSPTGAAEIVLGTRVDRLAAVVAVAVALVALLVQIYSTDYLAGDPRYSSYSALVSLFTAAMLLVVVSADLVALLVGWEVMGICSYFLVGHHWELPEARAAAVKAFLTTRLGDVGFLLGILTLGLSAGSFRLTTVLAHVPQMSPGLRLVAALLLLGGVVGKSAQFPLHTWLPDAMAGPTPVSALIHAATMVAAGVYLVARMYPLFLAAPTSLAVLGVLASITMLGGALAALAQDDIKRVLAYSTVSQIAYMAGALAVGSVPAGMFHLLTHAAFKALLFLCAGSVIHAVGSNLMAAMGGLWRVLPVTFVTMTIGLAALVGLPPFSGFVSKEAVLAAAERTARDGGPVASWVGWLVLGCGLATVAVTGAYATRLWLQVFFGARADVVHPGEVTSAMRTPLLVLAVPAALLGLAGLRAGWLPALLDGAHPASLEPSMAAGVLSTVLVLGGAVTVGVRWRRGRAGDPGPGPGRLRGLLADGFRVDAAYSAVVVRPALRLAYVVGRFDTRVVDGAVRGTGSRARSLGAAMRVAQAGNVQAYLTVAVVVVVVGAALSALGAGP